MTSISGLWHNQIGSEIFIEARPDGHLGGHMRSPVGLAKTSELFPVTGWILGETLAFTVNFGNHASLTAWMGHHVADKDGEALRMLWHMGLDVPHPERPGEAWKAIWTGADTFTRGPASLDAPPVPGGSIPPFPKR